MGPDVHFTTISKLETGKMTLTMAWARRIAAALEVDVGEIIGLRDDPLKPIRVRSLNKDTDWSVSQTHSLLPAMQQTEQCFYVSTKDIANIRSVWQHTNPNSIDSLIFIEPEFKTLQDGFFYLYRALNGEYHLGIYRDDPKRLDPPVGGADGKAAVFERASFEIVGHAVSIVEPLYAPSEPS